MKEQNRFIDTIESIVYNILDNEKLLTGQWHMGVVEAVNSNYSLNVYVNGSNVSQVIPCNPEVQFAVGDNVFVQYVNGNARDKYVPYKRATGTESILSKATTVISYKNTVTLTAASNTVAIGISEYVPSTDMLMVFENSVYIEQTNDYTVNASNDIVNANGTWNSGTVFNFIVIK